MRNVSSAFRRALSNDRRHYQIQAIIRLVDDVTVLTVGNDQIWENGLTIEDAVSNDNVFEIGGAIVNQCTLTINNIYGEFDAYDFDGAEVTVSVGLNDLDDGTDEMIQMGVWYVDDTSYDGSIIKLTCLDAMAKFDKPYTAHIVYPATIESIINDCCNRCGVTLASSTYNIPHRDFVVDVAPSGESTTYRQVLSWAAQIAVCFARINSNGELEVKFYDIQALEHETESGLDGGHFDSSSPYSSGDNADGGSFDVWETPGIADVDGGTFQEMRNNIVHISSTYSSHIATDDVIITGVTVIEKVTDEDSAESFMPYSQGRSGYVVTIEGNDLIQNTNGLQIATWMADQLIGFQFRKAELSHPDDPAIEAGDVGFFWDYKGNRYPIIISSTTFAPGNAQSTHSSAETPQRSSAAQFSASTKNYVEIRKQMMVQKTGFEAALDTLAEKVDEAGGLYDTEVEQPGGGVLTYYHNKPLLEDSDIRMLFSDVGFTMTADGGQTWYGMTVDGQMIASILQAHGISADWIRSGRLEVRDDNLNLIFAADKDDHSVYMSGDQVFIGNISVRQALENLSGVMSMTLSNETQGIPTDSEGHYDTFPSVTTDITVFYDGVDVTSQCTYTYSEFNVTGTLLTVGSVVRYTATSLTDDSGYVTFRAIYAASGGSVSASKMFTLFKVRSGEKGDAGSVLLYFLEPSTQIVKIGEDDTFYPPTIRWDAFTREGNTDIRNAYQGMFKVETTTNGSSWTTVESPTTIKTYTTYTPTDPNIVSVRCTLYSIGEFQTTYVGLAADADYVTVLVDNDNAWLEMEEVTEPISGFQQVDMESTAIVKDVSSLTQEEVFDILTNDGEVQGLYWIDNQLFISFNYARGGTLKLGGADNNGLLQVKDAGDALIGEFGVDGLKIYKGYINIGNNSFIVDNGGNVQIVKGTINLGSGSFVVDNNGNVTIGKGSINIGSGNFIVSSLGDVTIKQGSINLGGKFIARADGSVSMAEGSINAGMLDTGALVVRDNQNNIIFNADITNRSIFMNGDYVTLGGSPLPDAILDEIDDTMTQTEIFNRLTNNGAADALALVNGSIYLNASRINSGYITFDRSSGGTLTLGGRNNSSGQLVVKNNSDVQVASINRNGLSFSIGNTSMYTTTRYGASNSYDPPGSVESYGLAEQTSSGSTTWYGYYFPYLIDMMKVVSSSAQHHTDIRPGRITVDESYTRYFTLDAYRNSIETTMDFAVVGVGTKRRIYDTADYGYRSLYCYETPSPMFGDVGEGTIGDDGYCYIQIDPVFAETIYTGQYQVFLQKYGEGECYVSDRKSTYFIVRGTQGLDFGWEIKAKQGDMTQKRLDLKMESIIPGNQIDYIEDAQQHIDEIYRERELNA